MKNQRLVPKKNLHLVDFSPEEIERFTSFGAILKQIHVRLIACGYTITDGEIIPPDILKEPPKRYAARGKME